MNKHDVNIKKGKLINFQIGIIAVISFCYVMHEVSHYTPNKKKEVASNIIDDDPYQIALGPVIPYDDPRITIEEPKKIKSKPKQIKVTPEVKPEVVDNTTKIESDEKKTTITETEIKRDTPIIENTKTTTKITKTKKGNGVANLKTVDVMPVYPGCHKYSSNDELAVCFQEKIQRMINRKFNRSIGEELGISGKQYISLYFEINEQGQVSNIRARSKYPEFIKEAKRVAGLLPSMEPAQRSGQKVKMAYNVPITFQIKN